MSLSIELDSTSSTYYVKLDLYEVVYDYWHHIYNNSEHETFEINEFTTIYKTIYDNINTRFPLPSWKHSTVNVKSLLSTHQHEFYDTFSSEYYSNNKNYESYYSVCLDLCATWFQKIMIMKPKSIDESFAFMRLLKDMVETLKNKIINTIINTHIHQLIDHVKSYFPGFQLSLNEHENTTFISLHDRLVNEFNELCMHKGSSNEMMNRQTVNYLIWYIYGAGIHYIQDIETRLLETINETTINKWYFMLYIWFSDSHCYNVIEMYSNKFNAFNDMIVIMVNEIKGLISNPYVTEHMYEIIQTYLSNRNIPDSQILTYNLILVHAITGNNIDNMTLYLQSMV